MRSTFFPSLSLLSLSLSPLMCTLVLLFKPDLVPTSNPLPPSHLLPFLSLAQIRTLHLSIDINSPVPTTAQGTYLSFPFSRLVNTGTSSLNLQTLVVETRSGFIELDEKDSVYSYVKTKELVLILLPRPPPAKGEETCDPPMRSVTPSATRMGIEDVTIVMFPEVGGGGVYRPERLLGGLRRRGDEEGTLRFVLRLDRKRYSVQDLVGCLKYMIGQSCLPLRGWGGREGALVLDVETEEEFDAVEGWLERLKSVLNMAEEEKRCIKVVIQESRWWRE